MALEFPRLLYRAGGDCALETGFYSLLLVDDSQEFDAALADGWHLDQYAARAATEAPAPAPVADAPAELTREELEAKAQALGLKFDGRTSDKKLRDLIAKA